MPRGPRGEKRPARRAQRAIHVHVLQRHNLTMRMQMRRFTRLTNGFFEEIRQPLSCRSGEALTVQWPTGLHALMAFLQPDVLVDRLTIAINQIAKYAVSFGRTRGVDRQTRRGDRSSSAH